MQQLWYIGRSFSLGGIICLFYSWVSIRIWKEETDSAPVGCQWMSDPEKELWERGVWGGAVSEVPWLCKPLQFSLECLSLGLNPHGPPPTRFRLKFLHSARPCAPSSPSARRTPRGIQNALTPNQWETVKKARKRKKRKRKISLAT